MNVWPSVSDSFFLIEDLRALPAKHVTLVVYLRCRACLIHFVVLNEMMLADRLDVFLKLDIFFARNVVKLLEIGEFEVFGACSIEKVSHVAKTQKVHQLLGLLSSLLLLDLLLGLLFDHLDAHLRYVVHVDKLAQA